MPCGMWLMAPDPPVITPYQVMNSVGLSEQELVNDVLAVATLATVELSHSENLSQVHSMGPLT